MSRDKIGIDQWVEQIEGRIQRRRGLIGLAERAQARLPVWGWIVVLVGVALTLPLLTSNTFVLRVAGNVALLGTLALGLNIIVGFTGLLDLGFVAFYGIGAYTYAYLSSDFTGIHLPTELTLLFSAGIAALLGLLIGLTSLRLSGDYLAIVTLGFGLIFVQLMTSLTRVSLPGIDAPVNLTGGPNGIPRLDPLTLFGFTPRSVSEHYMLLVIVLGIALLAVYRLHQSRVGRAWTALREDELAAAAMGMPTRRLKIEALVTGAAIAGLCGGLFAGWQGSVFPSNFDTALLINLYAIVVLGGLGSIPGVLLGALVIVAVPDILRDAQLATVLFYAGILALLSASLKPRWVTPALLIALLVFGVVVRAVGLGLAADAFAPMPAAPSVFANAVREWLLVPVNATQAGNLAFFALVALVLTVTRLKHKLWRWIALVPTLYLLILVWETRLSQEPSVTRLLFVGVLLIALMIYRPNGILGQRRVEVV